MQVLQLVAVLAGSGRIERGTEHRQSGLSTLQMVSVVQTHPHL
jgi:hypothetical protein